LWRRQGLSWAVESRKAAEEEEEEDCHGNFKEGDMYFDLL
jgi:hypothetical protein